MIDILLTYSLKRTNPVKFDLYFRKAYNILADLNKEYGNFHKWYFQTVNTGLERKERSILIKEHNGEFAGISILKKNVTETKICTFRIMDKFQRLGIGQEMLTKSMNLLESNQPIITVSEKRISEFSKLLTNNHFTLFNEYKDYYYKGLAEFSFNGPIENLLVSQQQKGRKTVVDF